MKCCYVISWNLFSQQDPHKNPKQLHRFQAIFFYINDLVHYLYINQNFPIFSRVSFSEVENYDFSLLFFHLSFFVLFFF